MRRSAMYPHVVKPRSLSDYLDAMSHAVFQAGLNWKTVEAKWDGIKEAFDGFDPRKVAGFTPKDVERLMADPRVIHNRLKIQGTIDNAREMLVVAADFDGFDKYLKSFADNDDLVKDLHKRFKFLGESVAHFFLWRIGFNTEAQDAWGAKHFAGADQTHWTHR
jgi:DNA-3-methyladenine glycosylase I